jgi:hypothetical protein
LDAIAAFSHGTVVLDVLDLDVVVVVVVAWIHDPTIAAGIAGLGEEDATSGDGSSRELSPLQQLLLLLLLSLLPWLGSILREGLIR